MTIETTTLFAIVNIFIAIAMTIVGWFARSHASQIAAIKAENKEQAKSLNEITVRAGIAEVRVQAATLKAENKEQGLNELAVRLGIAEVKVHSANNGLEVFRHDLTGIRDTMATMATKDDLNLLQENLGQRITDALTPSAPAHVPSRGPSRRRKT